MFGNLGDDGAVILDAQDAVGRDVADVGGVQVPLLEDRLDLRLAPLLDDEQHALLRLGQHDLVGGHAGLALRDAADVDLDAAAAARSHLRRRTGQAGRAHVLDADERVGLHQLEARLEQQLLHERIADLHRRPLLGRLLVELRRRHRRAVDAVAAGLGADVVDRIAAAGGAALARARRASTMPRQNTLTSGLPAYESSNAISPPTVGMPMLLP